MELTDVRWEEFSLVDYFDMYTGQYYSVDSFRPGMTPLITAKSVNNGISYFTDIEPKFPSGCLTIGKVGLDVFYQYAPFVASSDVTVLKPKFNEYNHYIGKFIAVCAKQQSSVFGYGNQIRLNDSMKLKILLPTLIDGSPNWEFIKNYMRDIEEASIKKTKVFLREKLESQKAVVGSAQWKELPLEDIFEHIQRGKRLIKRDQVHGDIPYISSTSTNNGVDNFIGNREGVRIFENAITIANSGSVGATFYHPYHFIASDHVTVLKSEGASIHSYLFLVAVLSRLGEKYAFNREMSDKRIRREKIMVPVDSAGFPDWNYMETYMQNQEIESAIHWLESKRLFDLVTN